MRNVLTPVYNNQEDNEQQSYPSQLLMQPPIPSPPSDDFFKYRIDASDIIEEIEHKLKGEIWVTKPDGSGGWVRKYTEYLNDEGISVVLSLIYTYTHKGITLGNLTTEQINYKCNSLKKEVARLFFMEYKRYEIDESKLSLIVKIIVDTTHSALSRSEDGIEAYQISTATQRHEIYQGGKPQKDDGFFRRLFSRGGGK